jgi:hypothetical protein
MRGSWRSFPADLIQSLDRLLDDRPRFFEGDGRGQVVRTGWEVISIGASKFLEKIGGLRLLLLEAEEHFDPESFDPAEAAAQRAELTEPPK